MTPPESFLAAKCSMIWVEISGFLLPLASRKVFLSSLDAFGSVLSGRADLNRRPHGPEPRCKLLLLLAALGAVFAIRAEGG
jgi:hypothetical protein